MKKLGSFLDKWGKNQAHVRTYVGGLLRKSSRESHGHGLNDDTVSRAKPRDPERAGTKLKSSAVASRRRRFHLKLSHEGFPSFHSLFSLSFLSWKYTIVYVCPHWSLLWHELLACSGSGEQLQTSHGLTRCSDSVTELQKWKKKKKEKKELLPRKSRRQTDGIKEREEGRKEGMKKKKERRDVRVEPTHFCSSHRSNFMSSLCSSNTQFVEAEPAHMHSDITNTSTAALLCTLVKAKVTRKPLKLQKLQKLQRGSRNCSRVLLAFFQRL